MRIITLISEAYHRVSKQGNKYGAFVVEDYSAKTELMLWGNDYVQYSQFLQQGQSILITGCFKQRFGKDEFEFRISSIILAENVKMQLTKHLCLEIDVRNIQHEIGDLFNASCIV